MGQAGEEPTSNFAVPDERFFETWNFQDHQGRVYGSVPSKVPRRRSDRDGWLVVFIAPMEGKGPWYAVGCYENATLQNPRLLHPVPNRTPFTYCLTAAFEDAHLIKSNDRHLFPAPEIGHHFGNTKFIYARDPKKPESWDTDWRQRSAEFAERVRTFSSSNAT